MKLMKNYLPIVAFGLGGPALACWLLGITNAGNLGDAFGLSGALFSGIALIFALQNSVNQENQQAEFNNKLGEQLLQQGKVMEVLQRSIESQINASRTTAITHLISREEQRIDQLEDWGLQTYQDKNYYARGINASKDRLKQYDLQIHELAKLI
jgi:hypothetical protein